MEAQTLVLMAAGLFLLGPTQTIGRPKNCALHVPHTGTLEPDSGFVSTVSCSFTDPVLESGEYKTPVKITVYVSRSMDGWEISLGLAPGTNVRVDDVKGGQKTVRQSSTAVIFIFRNRLQRLQEGDSINLRFTVYSKHEDIDFSRATFHLQLPSPGQVASMCAGTVIHSPSAGFQRLGTKSRYRMRLNFKVDRGTSHWTTCKLNFNVPVQFVKIQYAEYVKRVLDTQFIIARSGDTVSQTVIDYEILRKKVKNDGYNNTVCRTCHWNSTSGGFIPETFPPETPSPGDIGSTPVLTTTRPVTTGISLVSSDASASHTERSSYVPTSPDDDRTHNRDGVLSQKPATQAVHLTNSITTEVSRNLPNPDNSRDQSSIPHAVWIGVAAGCAGALIVLLVVIGVLVMARKQSGTGSAPQAEPEIRERVRAASNAYASGAWNGTASNGHTPSSNGHTPCKHSSTSQFPSTPDSSTELLKDGSFLHGPDYEELDGFRVQCRPDFNDSVKYHHRGDDNPFSPVSDCLLLPGQRLNLPQTDQNKGASRSSIVESGDEDMQSEKTYVVMHSAYVEKDEQDD